MFRNRRVLLLPAFACLIFAIGADPEEARPQFKGWGEVIDPDKDCQIGLADGTLTITVPGTLHDLSAEFGDATAPRVLREFEGDFRATVKVDGKVMHAGDRTSQHYQAYHGVGLLAMADDATYLRLERAALSRGMHYINFELRKEAKVESTNGKPAADQLVFLRLERKGKVFSGAFSLDGDAWTDFDPIEVELPAKLKLGVAAINTSTEVLTAELSGLKVEQDGAPKP